MDDVSKETTSRALSGAEIAAAKDLDVERVEMPEWGGHVHLRTLGALEHVEFSERLQAVQAEAKSDTDRMIGVLDMLARFLSDERGERLYTDVEQARAALGGRNPKTLARLQRRILETFGKAEAAAKND